MLRMPFLKCFTLSINAFFHLKKKEREKIWAGRERKRNFKHLMGTKKKEKKKLKIHELTMR